MPKLSLNNIASGFATNSALNANFDAIEAAVENTLSRDGSTPNHMLSSLDMNSHSIHNLGRATTASSALSLGQFLEYATTMEDLTGVVPLTWEFSATGENAYSLPLLSTNKVDMYIISVDGLVLSPTTYTVNVDSQTIIFADAPVEGSSLVIRLFGKIPEATSTSVSFTGIRQTFPFDVVTDETTFVTTVTLDSNTDVYLNGVKLIINVDYTISGTSVILTSTAVIGDVVEVVTHSAAVVPSTILQDVIDATADAEALLLEVDTAIAESLSDVTATATTLATGEPATASFDVDTKVLTVGVPVGATGADGDAGLGLPIGGLTGQVLTKSSATDYHTGWANLLSDMYFAGDTTQVDGNLVFGNASPQKIMAEFTGEFDPADRLVFQTTEVDRWTALGIVPNGTSTSSYFVAYSDEDVTNASSALMGIVSSTFRVQSGISGTGTYLPITFLTNGSERMRIDTSGNVLLRSAAKLGYGVGTGAAVTQLTSRTTDTPAINKPSGSITLVSAAGSATPFTFTVPNSLVEATDTIILSQQSGANKYNFVVTNVTAGSFSITGYSLSGTTTEQPVINFTLLKGSVT